MATLTKQTITRTGLGPTYAAAAGGGDKFAPGDDTFLHVKNASGAPITVTVVTPGSVEGQAIADLTVSVPATTGDRMIGPFPLALFANSADSNLASITYSGVTSLTIAAVKLSA